MKFCWMRAVLLVVRALPVAQTLYSDIGGWNRPPGMGLTWALAAAERRRETETRDVWSLRFMAFSFRVGW
jgi:hypothetical protein